MTQKTCLSCEEPLAGRTDKKFCDDQCRSNYNNRKNSEASPLIRSINNTLKKNYRILQSIPLTAGKGKISKAKLTDKGFNFKYYTHQHTTAKGSTYHLCYDFAYLPIEGDYYFIAHWDKETH